MKTNLILPQTSRDRLLQLKAGEEGAIIVPMDMESYVYWESINETPQHSMINLYSPLQPNEEFYVGEDLYVVTRDKNGTTVKNPNICFEDGKPIGLYVTDAFSLEVSIFHNYWFEKVQMTPGQSRFHGVCVDVEVVKLIDIVTARSEEFADWLDYDTLVSQHNELHGTNIEPSLDAYVFYITVRRTK